MARRQQQQQQQQGQQSGPELKSASAMLAEAEDLLREGRADDALPIALRALDTLQGAVGRDSTTTAALPALNAVAEIYLELGDAATARSYFLRAVSLDPSGEIPASQGGGAEKFLYLAQLSDEGGQDSVTWFSRGAAILRRDIASSSSEEDDDGNQEDIFYEKRKKLAEALCGIIEVYMTDLSWEPTAESQCESLISEALLVAPHSAEPLQTLASIRISQARIPEAKRALSASMAVWANNLEDGEEDDGDNSVPDFATRVSLARLLMEAGMEDEALGVVERLVQEDDGSVESWYLGGWCLYLLAAGRERQNGDDSEDGMADWDDDGEKGVIVDDEEEEKNENENLPTHSLLSSREWLRQSLKLYELIEYEDERLRDHAVELVREIDKVVGEQEEEEWNGFQDDSEEEEKDEMDEV